MRKSIVYAALAAAMALACGASPTPRDDRGLLAVALTEVPPDVGCVQITVAGGARVFQKSWPVTSLNGQVLHASGMPTGHLVAVGTAYPAPAQGKACDIIGPEQPASWLSDAVEVTLKPGVEGQITLVLHPNGSAAISVSFMSDEADISTIAGGKVSDQSLPGAGSLQAPSGLAVDALDPLDPNSPFTLFISDAQANAVFVLDDTGPAPKFSRLTGSASGKAGYADGPLIDALFNNPAAEAELRPIWNPPNTGLAVADEGNCAIRLVDIDGDQVTTLAGGTCGGDGQDGPEGTTSLHDPRALVGATQGQRNVLFFIDGNAVRMLDATAGQVKTIAGSILEAGALDGTGGGMRLAQPNDLAYDGKGTLYVADTGNHAIRAIDISTGEGRTVAGVLGQQGHADGWAQSALLDAPMGVAFDQMGGLVITEATVTRRLAQGLVVTTAGAYGKSGDADGTFDAARFGGLGRVASFQCNLFATDAVNHSMRRGEY